MTSLLLVTRNAALPFALNSAGYDVRQVDGEGDVRWAEYTRDVDVVLLDVDVPSAAALLIDGLACGHGDVRVLLMAGTHAAWQDILVHEAPGVTVLSLPLTMPRLMEAIATVLAGPSLPHAAAADRQVTMSAASEHAEEQDLGTPTAPIAVETVPTVAHPAEEPVPAYIAVPAPLADDVPRQDRLPEPFDDTPWRKEEEPSHVDAGPVDVETITEAATAIFPRQMTLGQPPSPIAPPTVVVHPDVAAHPDVPARTVRAAPDPVSPAPIPPLEPPAPRAYSLVRSLTAAVDQLYSVGQTAEVILEEALILVPAESGALLLRDGAGWRVAAGRGLRALEHRLVLDRDDWLVEQVSSSSHGVLITGALGEWPQLYGVPLSSWPLLLAAPVQPVGGILLLARQEHPFVEHDLATVLELNAEAGPALADALAVRNLARLLEDFRDREGDGSHGAS